MFVAEAGMNSAGNRKELAKACGTYLLASRMRSVKEIGDEVLSAPGRYRKTSENLFAKEVVVSTGKRYVLCFNPQEAKRQQEHRAEIVHLLEEELARHKDRDASRKWAAELLVSRRFGPYLTVTDKGKLRIDRKAVQDAKRYDGKWVVETNDPTLTVEGRVEHCQRWPTTTTPRRTRLLRIRCGLTTGSAPSSNRTCGFTARLRLA